MSPGLSRFARIFVMRNGCPVQTASESDERRICPPPSPSAPSILITIYRRPARLDETSARQELTHLPGHERRCQQAHVTHLHRQVRAVAWNPGLAHGHRAIALFLEIREETAEADRASAGNHPKLPRAAPATRRAVEQQLLGNQWTDDSPEHRVASHRARRAAAQQRRAQDHDTARPDVALALALEIPRQHDAPEAMSDEVHMLRVDARDKGF